MVGGSVAIGALGTMFRADPEKNRKILLGMGAIAVVMLITTWACYTDGDRQEAKKAKTEARQRTRENEEKAEQAKIEAEREAKRKAAEAAALNALTPQEHIVKVRDYMEVASWDDARKHINALPDGHSQKKSLTAEVARKEAAEEQRIQIGARKEYARRLEVAFLNRGINARVTTQTEKADILRIEWILASRVTVHQLSQDTELQLQIRGFRFRRVVLTDGYSENWQWNYTY
jgi:hypothetical protein